MNSLSHIEKRLQLAGVLLILGLLVEAICLFWARPISFVILVGLGGTFLVLGLLVYLLSLVYIKSSPPSKLTRLKS